jgi:hypothetical protein
MLLMLTKLGLKKIACKESSLLDVYYYLYSKKMLPVLEG